jgi:HEAT repeat protein
VFKRSKGLVPDLIAALDNAGDDKARQTAAELLVKVGPKAVEPLIESLKRYGWGNKPAVYVAWALGQIGDCRAVEPLLALLDRDDDRQVAVAAMALGRLGDARAAKPLADKLRISGHRPEAARAICDALVGIGRPVVDEVMPYLIKLGRHWASRELAAWPLGRIGDLRALEPMLRATSPLAGDPLLVQSVADFGTEAVELLIGFLRDSDEYVRETAANVLGKIGDARAFDPLVTVLDDAKDRVRSAAAYSLGRFDHRAVGPLIRMLKDADFFTRADAVCSLGKIGDRVATPDLIHCLADTHPRVRTAAAEALARIGDHRAVDALQQAVDDRDIDVAKAARDAITAIVRKPSLP